MAGILKLAYKLLVNDRTKFSALLVGLTFAVFLMVQMLAMFAGVLNRSSSTVFNIGASMWVMDPAVQTVQSTIGMPDYVLDAVRSIQGVNYAVPLYSGGALAKLSDGTYQAVTVLGLDDTSLFGRPRLLEGRIEDVYGENAFIVVKDPEFPKLGNPRIGTEFQVNDHRGVIVGIAKVASSGLFGVPTLYTTYGRALQYLPNPRFTISYVLVEPKSASDVARIKREVTALGYLALTRDEFVDRISDFYKYQTGVGINIVIMTMMSFIVGLSISAQTFYTFVIENLEKFGALKAMGAKSRELIQMILFQASFTALTAYGLGVGLCAVVIALARMRKPDYAALITFGNLSVAFVVVVIIAGLSSYMGVRRVLRIEPFEIFRS
ncbi:MAG TPA: ABC transporter permease [Vicinamibacterales bacterium]|nr:ABC transporter permease [Vicinamibacterales bacterium]